MELNGQLGIPYRLFILFALFFYSSFFLIPDIFQVHMRALRTSTHVVTYHPCHTLLVVKKETVVG